MLQAVRDLVPTLLPFAHSAYSSSSSLFWEDRILESFEGVQQVDPLGPLLFCLTIHDLTTQLNSGFRVYLDDGTLGGRCDEVIRDLEVVERVAEQLGLQLNWLNLRSFVRIHQLWTSFSLFVPVFMLHHQNVPLYWVHPLVFLLTKVFLERFMT